MNTPQWEYCTLTQDGGGVSISGAGTLSVVPSEEPIMTTLAKLGEAGWEMTHKEGLTYNFKRQIQGDA